MYFRYKCGHVLPAPFWKDDCVYAMPGDCRDCRKKRITVTYETIKKDNKTLHIKRSQGGKNGPL